ncbi:MAG: GyrI-like domain-containing protein [Saprospiraceae bacterium]|nr:GyrI-like domain-containing protein [Saprospiraceae bacterium]
MKYEWRKAEKDLYLPKATPALVQLPAFKFFTIKGEGNPNDPAFEGYVGALYALSYAVRMSHKKGLAPEGYFEYTVYPLEGVWDITDEAKKVFDGKLNKDELVFHLMIRQPDFVNADFFEKMKARTMEGNTNPLVENVQFEVLEEGPCVQMLHLGSYDDEPASFEKMEAWAEANGWTRISKLHREIYLTDPRKTAPEKLKTVLRFKVRRA